MPEKEFELYLSLLGKLLRLSPQQKSSIEAELRDHFEERFEALVRSGVPRDQAIQKTLDEFGDVAGLAHEFTHLSRKHIRRRIMQGTAATVGVGAAVVIWATLFRGPEPAVGPAPNVVAQDNADESKADAANTEATVAADVVKQLDNVVAASQVEYIDPGQFLPEPFTKPIDIDFVATPLRDVITYIADTAGTNILLDIAVLSEQGITGDEEVSATARGVPIYAVLNSILRNVNDVELAWVQESEVFRVTTKEKADDTDTTQHYDIHDLLETGLTHESLLELIRNGTEGPWEEIDGIGGTLTAFGDLLIVKQCERTQVDVASTLAGLRSQAPVRLVGEMPAHATIQAALDSKTSIQFEGTPLRDVIAFIADIHKIPVALDVPALNEQGITGDEEVSLVVNGIKLRSALTLLLESVNGVELAPMIRDGALWITTKEFADADLRTVIYDVANVTHNDDIYCEQLADVIRTQTEGPWEDIDGVGGLLLTPTANLIACRQTMEAQRAVGRLIDVIRTSSSTATVRMPTATPLETRFYRMDAEAAQDVARLIPTLIEPGTWKGVAYATPEELALQIGSINQLSAGRMLLKLESGELINVPDKNPNNGSDHPENVEARKQAIDAANSQVAVIPQDILIITHKPAVLRQVSKLLQSLLGGDGGWTNHGAGEKVKFIAPGYQEGTWKGSLGSGVVVPASDGMGIGGGGGAGGGFGGSSFGGGGVGFFSLEPSLNP